MGRGGPHTGGTGYTTLDSGLNSQGVLFARTYFLGTASKDAGSASGTKATAEIARLARKVFNLVRFEHLLCDPESSRQVRTMPSWPRSLANFSRLQLYSHRNTWANLHLLGQPDTFLAPERRGHGAALHVR